MAQRAPSVLLLAVKRALDEEILTCRLVMNLLSRTTTDFLYQRGGSPGSAYPLRCLAQLCLLVTWGATSDGKISNPRLPPSIHVQGPSSNPRTTFPSCLVVQILQSSSIDHSRLTKTPRNRQSWMVDRAAARTRIWISTVRNTRPAFVASPGDYTMAPC